jgi:hypothetical protein
MRIITLEDLRRHALNVWGKDDGIEWVSEVFVPTANHETGTLRLHPIKSEAAYAVALHEIGHIRQGLGEDVLLDERLAWDWARDNALIWTPTMEREAERSMGSYEAGDDEAHLAAYYYDQISAFISDLLLCDPNGEQVYDALIRNAVELAELYELGDAREARRKLICLIDKYIAARRTLTHRRLRAELRRLRAELYTGLGGEERRKRESQIKWLRSRVGAANDPWIQAQIAELKKQLEGNPAG